MLAIERRNGILEKLQVERRVVVSELSQFYDVSDETIRRDLEKLETAGYAIKSYGGAVINENENIDLPFNIRKKHNIAGKRIIADLISDTIQDGDSIMLDASSTAVYIVKALKEKEKKNLTIVTNSVEIIIELQEQENWTVILTGGIARANTFVLVGTQTDKMLASYRVKTAIISCKGLEFGVGFTDTDELHAQNKRTMLDAGKQKILAIDSSKFDKSAFVIVGALKDVSQIVTDQKPKERYLQAFAEAGVTCTYPV
ncbi:MAG: DeoR/GlpR family DNA-binding transcription regulator [Lachnospiraceae bacterium]|nr:DeoR/GlpR family DNA-binding transcription regulator [Lachnospiraceae bacterium]